VIEVLSLFQRIPTTENIQALTDCDCWKLDFDVFQELYHSIPGFSEWGRLWMTNSLFHFKQRSVEMVTISAKERYLQLIKEKPQVILPSPLKNIGSYRGISDTSFSIILKEISLLTISYHRTSVVTKCYPSFVIHSLIFMLN